MQRGPGRRAVGRLNWESAAHVSSVLAAAAAAATSQSVLLMITIIPASLLHPSVESRLGHCPASPLNNAQYLSGSRKRVPFLCSFYFLLGFYNECRSQYSCLEEREKKIAAVVSRQLQKVGLYPRPAQSATSAHD